MNMNQDIGIGWEFYDHQLSSKVATGLCEIHVTNNMDKTSIASIVSVLEAALEQTKAMEGDLRDFPVQDVVYDIAGYAGNEVEVDRNIQAYGSKTFGRDCFEPTFVFSRFINNEWVSFLYGVDGGVEELTTFLFN